MIIDVLAVQAERVGIVHLHEDDPVRYEHSLDIHRSRACDHVAGADGYVVARRRVVESEAENDADPDEAQRT